MKNLRQEAEFLPVAETCADTVSAFLDLGRAYSSELDSTPNSVNEKFLQSILARQGEPYRWLQLLKYEGDCIGFVHAKIDHDDRPGWGYILEFYIVPSKRRSGWGRELFNHIVGILRQEGIREVWLTSNADAQAFWCSLGFKVTREEEHGQKVMVCTI